jgi:hypothetical protein
MEKKHTHTHTHTHKPTNLDPLNEFFVNFEFQIVIKKEKKVVIKFEDTLCIRSSITNKHLIAKCLCLVHGFLVHVNTT